MELLVYRAHDGEQVKIQSAQVRSCKSLSTLRELLAHATGIEPSLLISMTGDGVQLREDRITEWLGQQTTGAAVSLVNVFCFDRSILEGSVEVHVEGLNNGRDTPKLVLSNEQGHLIDLPSPTSGILANVSSSLAQMQERSEHITGAILNILTSTEVAHSNLGAHIASVAGPHRLFAEQIRTMSQKDDALISGHSRDLALVSLIQVHPAFFGSKSNKNTARTLADYVNKEKMLTIFDTCKIWQKDFEAKWLAYQHEIETILAEADKLKEVITSGNQALNEQISLSKVEETFNAARIALQDFESRPASDTLEIAANAEASALHYLEALVDLRNQVIHESLSRLQEISLLQTDLSPLFANLSSLQHNLKEDRHSFSYLSRLHEMPLAYCDTVAEIARRRAYFDVIAEKSDQFQSALALVAEEETRRRNLFRNQRGRSTPLPWLIKALSSENLSQIKVLSDLEGSETLPKIRKNDVAELADALGSIIQGSSSIKIKDNLKIALSDLQDALRRNISHIELYERLLGQVIHKSRLPIVPTPSDSLGDLRRKQEEVEDAHRDERDQLLEEIDGLRTELDVLRDGHQKMMDTEDAERDALLAELEAERSAHLQDVENRQAEHDLAMTTLQNRLAAEYDYRIDQSDIRFRASQGRALQAEKMLSERDKDISIASETLTSVQMELAAARRRIEDLEQAAEQHVEERSRQAEAAKHSQKSIIDLEERGLGLRKLLTEADEDRAELKSKLSTKEALLAQAETSLVSTRSWEHVVRSHGKALAKTWKDLHECARSLQELSRRPSSKRASNQNASPLKESPILPTSIPCPDENCLAILSSEAPDITQFESFISSFSRNVSVDAFHARASKYLQESHLLTRKWQKECKAYRDKARLSKESALAKIAFREFQVGELALFLPTRNTTERIFAAFNMNSPHHFVKPSRKYDELLEREWFVARILAVEVMDSSQNDLFGLGPNVQYHLLDVDPWPSSRDGPLDLSKSRSLVKRAKDVEVAPAPQANVSAEAHQAETATQAEGNEVLSSAEEDLVVSPTLSPIAAAKGHVSSQPPQRSASNSDEEVHLERLEFDEPNTPIPSNPAAAGAFEIRKIKPSTSQISTGSSHDLSMPGQLPSQSSSRAGSFQKSYLAPLAVQAKALPSLSGPTTPSGASPFAGSERGASAVAITNGRAGSHAHSQAGYFHDPQMTLGKMSSPPDIGARLRRSLSQYHQSSSPT